jgi:hypothetical protein
MQMKKSNDSNMKPVGDIVSSSAKWNNTPSTAISQKRLSNPKSEIRPKTPIAPKE